MLRFEPDLYDGEAVIEARGRSFPVEAAVASVQRRRGWFGYVSVPEVSQRDGFGPAVTQAARKREAVWLVLPDGRRGVVEIDDSLWFEGRGRWPASTPGQTIPA
jgi:hypothetical protein